MTLFPGHTVLCLPPHLIRVQTVDSCKASNLRLVGLPRDLVFSTLPCKISTNGPRVSPLGDHMTRKDDKGDQPSGGETTYIDKYWSDTIWQRKAQYRVIWRRHAEAFAQPLDTMAA